MAPNVPKLTPTFFMSYYHFMTHAFQNWEEPIDPNNPLHQMSLYLAMHEMAEILPDRAARAQIQSIIKKSIAEIAQKLSG